MALVESNDRDNDGAVSPHQFLTLLSGARCPFSHTCRIALLEKDVDGNIEYVTTRGNLARLGESNPYAETPTLIDREITLYPTSVIIEYIDDRFPHPPLLPIEPIQRAKTRLIMARLARDWLLPLKLLDENSRPKSRKVVSPPARLKMDIRDGLVALSSMFNHQQFLAGDEYSIADAFITPLLWRLPAYDIELPKQARPLLSYARRMFNRPTFAGSLSPQESAMR